MKIFFDTEFYEDGRNIELISIGMIREDGKTFYAETPQARTLARSTQWLAENVAIYLTLDNRHTYERWQIANSIVSFAGEQPEFWGYYADYDWVVLCQLFGTMMDLPPGWPMFAMDIKQLAVMMGNPKLPEQVGVEHHALADAKWAESAYGFLMDLSKA